MALTPRQRGDYHERQVIAALSALGWYVVRSAGSLGVADLVCLRADKQPLLVSCKLSGRIDPAERALLAETARKAGARPVVAAREHPGKVALYVLMTRTKKPLEYLDEIKVPTRRKPKCDPPGK